ncbi:MAG: ComF family protein [Clostridium sp.]|jgi:ComF family protein|nr:ComF family protein [Clostridium sp.]
MLQSVKLLLSFLFPPRCPICDDLRPLHAAPICTTCYAKLEWVESPFCYRCGKPLKNEETQYCHDCTKIKHFFYQGRAMLHYHTLAKSLYRLKYGNRQEYAAIYGRLMAEYFRDFLFKTGAQALIPVPLHPARKRKRGYNQAMLLAREISRITKIPMRDDIIKRVKNTIPLKSLTPLERQNNLKKSFHLTRNEVKLETVIIIDDIYTTGSTIDEMSRLLIRNGVSRVYFLTLACGAGS